MMWHSIIIVVALGVTYSESQMLPIPPLSSSEELVKNYGHKFESHEVQTEDGYLLTVHRLPGRGAPVLLLHGLVGSSDIFLITNKSIAYGLHKAGKDVWLGNFRGAVHSRKHKSLKPTEAKFWNFSLDEFGLLDIPAMIYYILDSSKNTKLHLIAFNVGTTAVFTMGSVKPQLNDKILSFTAIAPMYTVNRLSFFLNKDGFLYQPAYKFYQDTEKAKLYEAFARKDTPRSDIQFNCSLIEEGMQTYCAMLTDMMTQQCGDWLPAGTSLYTGSHLLQMAVNGVSVRYDHGKEENLKKYNTAIPPNITIDKITIPTHIIFSTGDEIVDISDVESVKMPNLVSKHIIDNEDFLHGDYVAMGNTELFPVYDKVIEFVKGVTLK